MNSKTVRHTLIDLGVVYIYIMCDKNVKTISRSISPSYMTKEKKNSTLIRKTKPERGLSRIKM